jgi:hypothetical protein
MSLMILLLTDLPGVISQSIFTKLTVCVCVMKCWILCVAKYLPQSLVTTCLDNRPLAQRGNRRGEHRCISQCYVNEGHWHANRPVIYLMSYTCFPPNRSTFVIKACCFQSHQALHEPTLCLKMCTLTDSWFRLHNIISELLSLNLE